MSSALGFDSTQSLAADTSSGEGIPRLHLKNEDLQGAR